MAGNEVGDGRRAPPPVADPPPITGESITPAVVSRDPEE
jgi:hypothetical protein